MPDKCLVLISSQSTYQAFLPYSKKETSGISLCYSEMNLLLLRGKK